MSDAALVFEGTQPSSPGTHVLLIGVSAYDHLLGGPQEKREIAGRMGQLDSPSRSARKLADWFLDEFDNPELPLQSLSLVVSEAQSAGYEHARATNGSMRPPPATLANVTSAISGWIERASTDPENMIVLFFAGHGISSTADPLLFLQDFGAQQINPFGNAINLTEFLFGLKTQVPSKQLILIDACRLAERVQTGIERAKKGVAIVGTQPTDGRPLAHQSVHHSTAEFLGSYGELNGISLFADALIRALRGGGAQSQARWHVTTSGIEVALGAYVLRASAQYGVEQVPERSSSRLFNVCKPKGPLTVPLYVSLNKQPAWVQLENMEARCASGVSASWTADPAKPVSEWACVVPLREHEVAAKFQLGARYSHVAEIVIPGPPEASCVLTIEEA